MTYLLDTNVVSEIRKPDRDSNVAHWAAALSEHDIFLSVVTIRELEAGILRLERRDATQAAPLREWFLTGVLQGYADRILPIDVAIARRSAALHVPDPQPERDALIAATALTHGMTVATRNVGDFEPMGVPVVNPWQA